MEIFDCGGSRGAWAACKTYSELAADAGIRLVAEDLRSAIRSLASQSSFVGFARWNAAADSDLLAVVAEGLGWAIDDRERVELRAGQGALWRRGEWAAFGANGDPITELRRFSRMLVLAGEELSLDRLMAGNRTAGSYPTAPVTELDPATETLPMQVFDCGKEAAARACFYRYADARAHEGLPMGRGRATKASRGGTAGGERWHTNRLVVFLQGGWAADARTRQSLHAGQCVFWPAGSWWAYGHNGEMLTVEAPTLSVETFLHDGLTQT